ncbi:hypothetical protein BaRGS_00015350 [Batillaria attramentaria]|uniref:Aminopeptidase NAALADL1 n=1 Tax=Batillaria attramentaria TaxID=370345 RepID=A0ABD0L2V1_9CAEN
MTINVDKGENYKSSKKVCLFSLLVVGILAFVVGILIGRFAACPEPEGVDRLVQDGDQEIADILIQTIEARNIENNLREITRKPHIAGEQADYDLVDYLKKKLTEYGLDSVKTAPYEVLLTYPHPKKTSSIQLLDDTSNTVFDSVTAESKFSADEGVVPPFNAYSPAGEVQGELVYVNYGREEDYDYLKNVSISVKGKIVISRYGKLFRGNKVDIAARHGALGVILYSDPADYALYQDEEHVYPHTWWLLPTGAQRGSIARGTGDPLTPGYPATRTAYRYSLSDIKARMPTIPAHPIGYGAARHFLEQLTGPEVPESWRGALNLTYRFGPGFNSSGWSVKMSINTVKSMRRIHNVIGIIRGKIEPDRYVLIGNHRDAWVYGAMDPSGGTAAMMEVARAMGRLVKDGRWRPRRSIMFCSWGAEEYALIGSNEWIEQYIKSLRARAVGYINIDVAVQGNYTLTSNASPLLYRALYAATKRIPNPNSDDVKAGRLSVYDSWVLRKPLDGRSKYQIASYPLYHTEHETFYAVKNLIDPDFKCHQAVARVGAELVRYLADSLIIPFNVTDYAVQLTRLKKTLDDDYGTLLSANISNYKELDTAIAQFGENVQQFQSALAQVDRKDPMAIRLINDQLLLLERAFLDPEGLPQRPLTKHLIFADNANDLYAGTSFPGLVDLLFKIEELQEPEYSKRWQEVRHHFSVIVNAIQSAGYTLRDVISFVEEKY